MYSNQNRRTDGSTSKQIAPLATRQKTKKDAPENSVLMIGPFPPPVHGASVITEAAARLLQLDGQQITRVNVGAEGRGPGYHWKRTRRYAAASVAIARCSRRVYLSLSGGAGLWYDLLLVSLGALVGRVFVFHHHSFAYLNRPNPVLRLITLIAAERQTHIALCPTMANKLRTLYGSSLTCVVISNFAFLDVGVLDQVRVRGTLSTIGYLSNVTLAKGADRFLDLMQGLEASGCNVRGILAGPCADPQTFDYVERRTAEIPAVSYRGAIYGKDKAQFFESVDLFVFPSRYTNEAQPLVLYEAALAGIPTVATDRGCIPDLIRDGSLLLDANASNLDELTSSIRSWVDDAEKFARVSHSAAEFRKELLALRNDERTRFLELFRQCSNASRGDGRVFR